MTDTVIQWGGFLELRRFPCTNNAQWRLGHRDNREYDLPDNDTLQKLYAQTFPDEREPLIINDRGANFVLLSISVTVTWDKFTTFLELIMWSCMTHA